MLIAGGLAARRLSPPVGTARRAAATEREGGAAVGRTLFGDLAKASSTFSNRTPVSYPSPPAPDSAHQLLRPAGQEAQMRAMGGSSTLFAIVDRITTAYSGVEWHLYRSAPSGRDEDRVEVTSHAALDLWNAAQQVHDRAAFRESTQQHEELVGEQWWVIGRDESFNIPLELWPVRPDRMEPVPTVDDFLVGYMYTSGRRGAHPPRARRRHLPAAAEPAGPVPRHGCRADDPHGPRRHRASRRVERELLPQQRRARRHRRGRQAPDDEEFNEFRDRWSEQHRACPTRTGSRPGERAQVGRPLVLHAGHAVHGAAQRQPEIIREAFAFPKPMLGTVDDVNRANAEAADVRARPLARSAPPQAGTRQAQHPAPAHVRGDRRGLEFDFDNPVPEDVEAGARI
jgi:hypothetical protein